MPTSSLNNSSQDALRHRTTHFTVYKSALVWFLLPLLGAAAFRYYYTFGLNIFSSIEPEIATNDMTSVPLRALTLAARAKHSATIIFVHVRIHVHSGSHSLHDFKLLILINFLLWSGFRRFGRRLGVRCEAVGISKGASPC